MYKLLIRPIIFLFSAEKAHYLTFFNLKILFSLPFAAKIAKKSVNYSPKNKNSHVLAEKHLSHPIGLAAGLDKNASHIYELALLGFSFIEVGTVTPKAQPGNPRPRLFRLKKDRALINRMGFNNHGVLPMKKNLEKWHFKKEKAGLNTLVGVNIGKNKWVDESKAVDDYVECLIAIGNLADYFAVNVSSPNTPGLRDLQKKEQLLTILGKLQEEKKKRKIRAPIYLKIAPDLDEVAIQQAVEAVHESGSQGIISSNTTTSREGLVSSKKKVEAIGQGGLSGAPLYEKSNTILEIVTKHNKQKVPIIGVGGIETEEQVKEKLNLGANLVQVYTGFIYHGPFWLKKLIRSFK